MRLDVGPVAPGGAVAWIGWARSTADLPRDAVDDVGRYLERWMAGSGTRNEMRCWTVEIDPDELEYLAVACHRLDDALPRGPSVGAGTVPVDGREFYLVLVGALLHALENVSPVRAAFADQLRSSWAAAAAAR